MRTIQRSVLNSLCLGAVALLSGGCATIAGGYRIPDSSTHARSYSSIAGDIDVGRQASIRNADTIAGDIDIGEGSRVRSLDSIAGQIRLAADVSVEGSVETIAGDIRIARGCTIGGNVETIAGRISITESVVKRDVIIRHGELDLVRTRVLGVVRVKRAKDKDDDEDTPEINIGPDSEVTEVVVDEKSIVHLRIHRSAKVGPIKGAEAEYYD